MVASPCQRVLQLFTAVLLAGLVSGCAGTPTDLLVVGSDLANEPFAWVDEDGTPRGRDVEMMEHMGELLDRRIVWRRMPFDELLDAVEAREVDIVCATMGITPERAERVAFSTPYFETAIRAVVRRGPGEPATLADLAGRRVSAGAGTTSQRAVEAHMPDAIGVYENKAGLPTAERLLQREVDAAVMDGPNAEALAAEFPEQLTLLPASVETEDYGLVLSRDAVPLTQAVDRVLSTLRPEWLAELNTRYGLVSLYDPSRRYGF